MGVSMSTQKKTNRSANQNLRIKNEGKEQTQPLEDDSNNNKIIVKRMNIREWRECRGVS